MDIWSFGVILYELYVGITPFHCNCYNKLIVKILHDQIRYPKNTPIEFRQLIDAILNKNSNNRFDWPQIETHPFFKVQEALK